MHQNCAFLVHFFEVFNLKICFLSVLLSRISSAVSVQNPSKKEIKKNVSGCFTHRWLCLLRGRRFVDSFACATFSGNKLDSRRDFDHARLLCRALVMQTNWHIGQKLICQKLLCNSQYCHNNFWHFVLLDFEFLDIL